MKHRVVIGAALVAAMAVLGGVACGGGDSDDDSGDEPQIRTQKGLAVAAASENLGVDIGASSGEETSGNGFAAPAMEERDGAAADIARTTFGTDPYFPFPNFATQQNADGITVAGYGSASAAADSAVIEFSFGSSGGVSPGVPETRSSSGSAGSSEPVADDADFAQQEVPAITEADLQPVIDALVGAGVAREDIEFIGQTYYDPYFASATLRATVRNTTGVDAAVEAARIAAGGIPNVQLQSTNVSYTLQDCSALESAAMQAAVEDAGERAQALATVLGVGVGAVTGASNYSYSPYGGTPCDTGSFGPYPLGGVVYQEGQANEVTVFSQLGVTYAIQ
jgi:uncharacterized protein YggE